MNIEKYLKSIHFTKLNLATSLGISRPTLDKYIERYNNGLPLKNNKYQTIFNYLFEKELPREVFLNQLGKLKNAFLEKAEIPLLGKKYNWMVIRTNDDISRKELSTLLNEGYVVSNSISVGTEVEYILYKECEERSL